MVTLLAVARYQSREIMQRFNQELEIDSSDFLEIKRRTAFHEAGHAAAIYLENRRKNLPLVYFQIRTRKFCGQATPFFSEICGGRQIGDGLIMSSASLAERYNLTDMAAYKTAYEADIINILAVPLAEAKYEFLRHHQEFSISALGPDVLRHYGGSADMQEVWYYLRCVIASRQEQERTLQELFSEAFQFVQEFDNWKQITELAEYILDGTEEYICYEQVNQVFHDYKRCAKIH